MFRQVLELPCCYQMFSKLSSTNTNAFQGAWGAWYRLCPSYDQTRVMLWIYADSVCLHCSPFPFWNVSLIRVGYLLVKATFVKKKKATPTSRKFLDIYSWLAGLMFMSFSFGFMMFYLTASRDFLHNNADCSLLFRPSRVLRLLFGVIFSTAGFSWSFIVFVYTVLYAGQHYALSWTRSAIPSLLPTNCLLFVTIIIFVRCDQPLQLRFRGMPDNESLGFRYVTLSGTPS